ncbi:MAG TPA: hypothetical protein VKW08_04890 [Xanthobacteraceae bacterium]|nr:hypothetical protein [Xanthobacteraceae bacterium]
MMLVATAAFLLGIALGQRFPVLIVLPASFLQLIFAAGAGFALHLGGWLLIFGVSAAVGSLQLGYLAGSSTRHLGGEADLRSARFRGRDGRAPSLR